MAARFSGDGEPFNGFVRIANGHPQWTGKVELVEKHLLDPMQWRTPRRVFVNSMSDLFHEGLPDAAIDRVFAVMAMCPQHTMQCLTKRPARMLRYIANRPDRAFSNVWLGCSVEDQQRADERREPMRQLAEAGWNTFVSYEPALGPVDWTGWEFLRWLIIGGESGPGARPFDIAWMRSSIAWCRAHGIPPFAKQLGAHPIGCEVILFDRKGSDMVEWSEDLRVREFPRGAPDTWTNANRHARTRSEFPKEK